MKNKILLFGGNGLVGERFCELYKNKDELIVPTISDVDITDVDLLSKYIKEVNPSTIINFAAFTDVGKAEEQRGKKKGDCWKINVEGVKNLLNSVGKDTYLVHISTDMVFEGSDEEKGPFKESQTPLINEEKLTWYGYTKAVGEKHIIESGKNVGVLRIIYPVRAQFVEKLDYLRKPLKFYKEGKLYPLFSDQQISITFIDEASLVLEKMLKEKVNQTLHCSSSNLTTPHQAVSYLIKKLFGENIEIEKSSLKSLNLPSFRYPLFGGLSSEKTQKELNLKFSSWQEIVDKLIEQGITNSI